MMEKRELLFTADIEEKIVLEVNQYDPDQTLEDMSITDIVNGLTEEECRQLLIKGTKHFTIHEYTERGVVKRALDLFDPYFIGPFADGPYNEYEPEVEAIVERMNYGMEREDIQKLVEAIFIFYFSSTFDSDIYAEPAREIHRFYDEVFTETRKKEMEKELDD